MTFEWKPGTKGFNEVNHECATHWFSQRYLFQNLFIDIWSKYILFDWVLKLIFHLRKISSDKSNKTKGQGFSLFFETPHNKRNTPIYCFSLEYLGQICFVCCVLFLWLVLFHFSKKCFLFTKHTGDFLSFFSQINFSVAFW